MRRTRVDESQVCFIPGPKLIEAESSVQERIRLAVAGAGGVIVMRNSVGVARHGKRYVRYGLGVGSSDLICIVAPHGRFLGIEVKRPKGGKESKEQTQWMDSVRRYGGVVGVATSVSDALALVARARALE